jgi:hypothetical protein
VRNVPVRMDLWTRRSISASRHSFYDLIRLGQYDCIEEDVLLFERACPTHNHNAVIRFFHCNETVTPAEVTDAMKKAGYRPICGRELLMLGATYPRSQYRFPILALGLTIVHPKYGWRACLCLSSSRTNSLLTPSGRHLSVLPRDPSSFGPHRFGAVSVP